MHNTLLRTCLYTLVVLGHVSSSSSSADRALNRSELTVLDTIDMEVNETRILINACERKATLLRDLKEVYSAGQRWAEPAAQRDRPQKSEPASSKMSTDDAVFDDYFAKRHIFELEHEVTAIGVMGFSQRNGGKGGGGRQGRKSRKSSAASIAGMMHMAIVADNKGVIHFFEISSGERIAS
jgi:hypothetical protein